MTGPRAIWLGLATLAGAWGVFLGVPIWASTVIFTCAILPPLVGTFLRRFPVDGIGALVAEIGHVVGTFMRGSTTDA